MLLFTQAIPRPAIWGGTLIRKYFHYPQFPDGIGQSWSFSCMKGEGESNIITDGPYAGKTLLDVWEHEPQLFHSRHARFPVIISLVAPMDDLSIQVHPTDAVAAKSGYATGKNEAWYFLEAPEHSTIVYGQNARDEAGLRNMIAKDQWSDLIRHLPVKQGDFVYLPAGMVHALKKGNIVYEIQQSTDVTYRFFDYHRKDAKGQERPLQLEEAIACVDYALDDTCAHPEQATSRLAGATITTFIANDSFCVRRYEISGTQDFSFDTYQLMTCVKGEGRANGRNIGIGESFLVTAGSALTLEGNCTLMCTSEE